MSCPPTPNANTTDAHSANGALSLTPQNNERANGTVVFLREEGQCDFVPLHHPSSVTLQELVDEFNISSVVECDARGNVQPRAVAFDSPSDVLHSGRHYVVRRDARNEARGSRVTFRGKIQVKEYELEHTTPPAHRPPTDGHRPPAFFSAIGTPLPFGHRIADDENSLSHSLVSGQKRPRDEDGSDDVDAEETNRAQPQAKLENEEETAQQRVQPGAVTTVGSDGTAPEPATATATATAAAPRVLFFSDRTNTVTAPAGTKPETTSVASASVEGVETNKENNAAAAPTPPRSSAPLRFIPFPIASDDGTETLITLEDLKAMCAEDDTEQQRQRHEETLSILESARRVLFKSP